MTARSKALWICAAALAALAVSAPGARGVSGGDTISTLPGSEVGLSGDGGPATVAQLRRSSGVAVDRQGNVYIADTFNHRVRRVSGGSITTIAGTGTSGGSGDGGLATSAHLSFPTGVAVDGQGNVYIADTGNHRVRRVTGGGIRVPRFISTFAGTGTPGFSGDGGSAASAQLREPQGVAVDGQGNLYVADTGNHRVRRVSGGRITTIAGTGTAGFSGDGGPAAAAQLNHPTGLAVGQGGNVYITDTGNNRVRRVSSGGVRVPRFISTFAGTGVRGFGIGDGGPATAAHLESPFGVAVDRQGHVYIADTGNHRVRRVSGTTITTIAGTGIAGVSGDGGPAAVARLRFPEDLAVDGRGNLYIAGNRRVRVVANTAPVAFFRATAASGRAPLVVRFDASGSSDPNGTVASYVWDFGDGTTGSGRAPRHTYEQAGSFNAKLTVTDELGATASAERTISVEAAPPPAAVQ